jgi:WD40 repeat protein
MCGFRSLPLASCAVGLIIGAAVFADALAEDKTAVEIVPNMGHFSPITSVAFSPDGIHVLSGSFDGGIKLWRVQSGRLVRTFAGHTGGISSVAFSPDGARVLSGSGDGTVNIWETMTGRLIHTFNAGSFGAVAFSPDGTRVVSGNHDLTLKLWEAASGRLIRTFDGHSNGISSVAFSPDGTRVLSGSYDQTVKLWEAVSGKLIRTFQGHYGGIGSVAFSPDGMRLLSGGNDYTVKLWDVDSGRLMLTFTGHSAAVSSVAFSPDGSRVLSGSGDGTVKVWEAASAVLIHTFKGHLQAVTSVAFSPDGARALSGSGDLGDYRADGDFSAKLWDAKSGKLIRTFEGNSSWVGSVAFSSDGARVLSASYDKRVKLWDAKSGRLIRTFENSAWVEAVAFSPDGTRVLAGSGDGTSRIWDAESGRLIRTFKRNAIVRSVAFSPDGASILRGYDDGIVELRDATTGRLLRTFEAGGTSVAFSSDGARVLSGGSSVAFSPDGSRLISAGAFGGVKLWDARSGRLIRAWPVEVAPDGHLLLKGNDIKLVDATTGQLIRSFTGHSDAVSSVVFSRDGRRLLSGSSDSTIKLWDAETGRLIRTFTGHSFRINSVAFSPDGDRVLSGSTDGTVKIWNSANGDLIATLLSDHELEHVAITPQGFFTASPKGDEVLTVVRGLEITTIGQIRQSLFSPDLVRAALAGDPDHEVKLAAEVINLDKVVDSGPAPLVEIISGTSVSRSSTDLVTTTARIKDRGNGVGRIEWRVNGVTTAVTNVPAGAGPDYEVRQTLALDPGENLIEVVAYNARNLLASVPAQTTITYTGPADAVRSKLYVLAIGINSYHDDGWVGPGAVQAEYFPPLNLAVGDAKSFAGEIKKAAEGLYSEVRVTTALDIEATFTGLDQIVQGISAEINPRDTFVLFAAAHGYSNNGRFYLIPQDYQGGTNPVALSSRAIGQEHLQDWIGNRIKAKKVLILLDTCESGALTNGYTHSRVDAPASEGAVGRLHEATGRPVLTAAAAGKPAFGGYHGRGVFTWALIDAFYHGDTNGDRLIELSELVTHVQNTVPKISEELNGTGQAAIALQGLVGQSAHFGSAGGDFALVRRLQ